MNSSFVVLLLRGPIDMNSSFVVYVRRREGQ